MQEAISDRDLVVASRREVIRDNKLLLEFAYAQRSPDPKDGLFLYGPHARAERTWEVLTNGVGHDLLP
ncbi:hypothetical protein NA8A_23939 [Nitratireductor indicus C115]|uniref:Uncharacterized protein n=1 Tax=Nitratireductor indicus C115 TaxID=1231190 RepID=K2NXK3_9HYPH|nr:hypothetical protein NA8A_23939 [Nitratireductor indicus C115]SFQ59173.1 hypothetical protein SAMN05216176_1077 [Nitratireductor indicus]